MKSCLGLLLVLGIFILVFGGAALIWYLSDTAEFSRGASPPPTSAPPAARPAR